MILSQKKDRCVAAMKDLELTYKADCRYLNGELERLKDDILMASKRESDAETKLSEVFETLLNQLVDYDKELKSIYELYHNKDIEVVSTNIQDIECYYSNPSINY